MTHDSLRSDELFRLFSELVDGTLTESQVVRLRELLRDDPQAQDLYLNYMGVHAQLHLDYGSGSTPVAMPGGSSMPLAPSSHSPLGPEPIGGDVLGALPQAGAARASWPTSPWPFAMAFGGGLAAALLVIGLAAMFWSRDRRGAPAVAQTEAPAGAVAQRPPQLEPAESLAVVVQLARAEWEQEGGRKLSVGEILPASRLVLRSGRVTLALLNGVMLTLEGPADLELVSINRVFCHRGKIRAWVPVAARGFVVSAPKSDVVDLGTEFGLNVDADSKARMMVFKGEANAAVFVPSGSAQRNRYVTEHRALEIDPLRGQFDEAEARSESFVPPPVLAIPPLALAPSYREAVLEARPWSYWRFEAMNGGAVTNEVAGRPSLRATGPVRLAGVGNRTVAFGPPEAEQYLMMDGRWAPPRDPGYAVELWFSPERIGAAELAALFVPRGGSDYDHMFQLELTARTSESILFQRYSIRFLHRWPPSVGPSGDNLFFNHYVPYRWYHVVAQTRGDQMELYVNGAALSPLSLSPDRATEACQFLVGRLKPLPRPPKASEIRPFVGQIDELALYDHPLSAEEVRHHYALGSPGGRPSEP
jgi:hypothetical protein